MTGDDTAAPVDETAHHRALEAIRDHQHDRGLPALTRSELDAALGGVANDVDVDALVASGSLGCFEPGDDRVYWVADDDHAGGYVDVAHETPDSEGEDATTPTDDGGERAAGPPESTSTLGDRISGLGDTLLRASALLFAVGLGIIFADGPLLASVYLSEGTIEAGEYLFLVGIVTVVLALVLVAVGLAGRVARGRNWTLAGSREGQQHAD